MESKIPAVEVKLGFKWQGLLIAVIVGLGIWLIPTPEGLSAKAWGMLALFVATIVAIIAKAMPMGAATLVALVISGLTGLFHQNKVTLVCYPALQTAQFG